MKKLLLLGVACLLLTLNLYSQDFTYCYDSGETDVVTFEVCPSPGATATASICQGSFEDTYDFLTVYEGAAGSATTGTIVLGPADGDLTGTDIVASAADLCLIFVSNSDGSISCASTDEVELHVYTAGCPACMAPATRPLAGASLTLGGACVDGDNTGAGEEADEPQGSCFVGGTQSSVWYQVTGDGSDITITTDFADGTNGDTEVAVYTFVDPASYCDVTEVACDQDGGSNEIYNSIATFTSTSGTDYYIQVSGYNGTEGTYQIQAFSAISPRCEITSVTGVENGDCDPGTETYTATVSINTAGAVSTGMFSVNGQTFAADGSNPLIVVLNGLNADGAPVDLDVTYDLDPCCSGSALAAFTAPTCSATCTVNSITAATPTACSYDSGTGLATYSIDITVVYSSPPGTGSLDITVDGITQNFPPATSPQIITLTGLIADGLDKDVTAAFSDDVLCTLTEIALYTASADCTPPAEDNCMGAITIPVTADMCTGLTTGNNTGSTDSDTDVPPPPAASCSAYAGGDIWFTLIVPASGNVTISGGNSDGCCSYLWYEVYEGADCSALASIACSDTNSGTDNNDPSTYETALSGLTAGSSIWVRAWDSSNDNGPGDFNFCAYEPSCGAPTVTIPADAIDNTNCPTTVDVSISIDNLGDSGTLTISAEDDLGNPAGTGGTTMATGVFIITNVPVPQTSWTITIAHESDTMCDVVLGPFVLNCPPDNDAACDAEALIVDAAPTPGILAYSTFETNEVPGSCWGSTTVGNSVWYSFVAPTSGVVEITTDFVTGSDDTQLALYTLTDCSDLLTATEIACSEDDGATGNGWMAVINTVSAPLVGGDTYYVQVDGYGANIGDFEIQINTLCDAATKVVLPTMTTTAVAADACTDSADGFTYYSAAGSSDYIFAINWAPSGTITPANQAAKDVAMVEITKYNASGTGTGAYDAPGNSAAASSFAMLTSWNVNLGAEAIDDPVNVKFYYPVAEKTAVDGAATLLGYPDLNPGGWYKNEGSDYNHNPVVTAVDFQGSVTLLDDVSAGGTDNGITYARFDAVASFSGGSYAAGSGAGILPIKLDRFTAKADGRHNMIEWTTASEINVQDHTLMKSDDSNTWEVLGVISGEINSSSDLDYEMMDINPFSTTYYQLMTTDIDGTTSYSPMVSVTRDTERSSEFLGASPVPTVDVVNLNVFSSGDDNITITLTDISGKRIFIDNRVISNGNHQLPLDLSNMTNGIYMVTITSDLIQQTHRVIKN